MIFKTDNPEDIKAGLEAFWKEFLRLKEKPVTATNGGYVSRGTVAAYDFDEGDLIINDYKHTLDISSIIPSNATAVNIRFRFRGDAEDQFIWYDGDYTTGVNGSRFRTQAASVYFEDTAIVVPVNGIIQYLAETSVTQVDIVIIGWWL